MTTIDRSSERIPAGGEVGLERDQDGERATDTRNAVLSELYRTIEPPPSPAGESAEASNHDTRRAAADVDPTAEAGAIDRLGPVDINRRSVVPCWKDRPNRVFELTGADASISDTDAAMIAVAREQIAAILDTAEGRDLSLDDVEKAIGHVNPTGSTRNCVECALAVDDLLAGRPAVAGPSKGQDLGDGAIRAIDARADTYWANTDPAYVGNLLLEAGSGARGILMAYREDGPSHAYNIANIDGHLRYLDGQDGLIALGELVPNTWELDFYRTGGST